MPAAGPGRGRRKGRAYLHAREVMFAKYGTVCHICGHEGSTQADHITPAADDPMAPHDPDMMRPAHGNDAPCQICEGEGRNGSCNQSRGRKGVEQVKAQRNGLFRPTHKWLRGKPLE
jgi:hypothetical protein